MLVKDYMFTNVNTATIDFTVAEAIKKLVETKTNSLIIIDDDQKPIGLISAQTILKNIVPEYLKTNTITATYGVEGTVEKHLEEIKDKKIGEIMFTDIKVLTQDDALIEASTYVLKGARRIIPVVNKQTKKLVGAMTRTSLKNALYDTLYPKKSTKKN